MSGITDLVIALNNPRLGVVGSRNFLDYSVVKIFLGEFEKRFGIGKIVSGGARGADSLGERYADERGIPKLIHLPDWDRFGRQAGFIRNVLIVEDSEIIIAFWDGRSRGTQNTIETAHRAGKPCVVVLPDSTSYLWPKKI